MRWEYTHAQKKRKYFETRLLIDNRMSWFMFYIVMLRYGYSKFLMTLKILYYDKARVMPPAKLLTKTSLGALIWCNEMKLMGDSYSALIGCDYSVSKWNYSRSFLKKITMNCLSENFARTKFTLVRWKSVWNCCCQGRSLSVSIKRHCATF